MAAPAPATAPATIAASTAPATIAASTAPATITLECIKIGSRLRVRVVTPGYFRDANCQFPRALRREGARYHVPAAQLRFIQGGNRKYYYSVAAKHVTVVDPSALGVAAAVPFAAAAPLAAAAPGAAAAPLTLHVYGDDDADDECAVCFDSAKEAVLVPCGHYCMCSPCAARCAQSGTCPMCRAAIAQVITRDQINAL